MIHDLFFINPELRKGINVTVRRGEKWFMNASIGDLVAIKDQDKPGKPLANGWIRGIAYIPYLLIPYEWLALEHDELCMNMDGLTKVMVQAYPDFHPTEMVTVIIFEIKD